MLAITVNTNVPALTAQRYLSQSTEQLDTAMERLASGLRINSAKDDAAGLQISNRLTVQSQGLGVAMRNASDAISMSQTAEGAMEESTTVLQRMRELALQAANGSNGPSERAALQEEVASLKAELNRIAETTSFGGTRLLNGTYGKTAFQIGPDAGEAVFMSFENVRADVPDMGGELYTSTKTAADNMKDWTAATTASFSINVTNPDSTIMTATMSVKTGTDIEQLATFINGHDSNLVSASVTEDGILQVVSKPGTTVAFSGVAAASVGMNGATAANKTVSDIDVTSVGGAQAAIGLVDNAMKYIDSHRADLGAQQNRLSHSIANLANIQENVVASNSRIKDVDFAKETTELTKYQILQQSGASILAQAKQAPQIALSLLG